MRQRRQAAEAGKVSGGGNRPFGYEADRITVRESEAALIREGARRVLASESLSSICRDWQARHPDGPQPPHQRGGYGAAQLPPVRHPAVRQDAAGRDRVRSRHGRSSAAGVPRYVCPNVPGTDACGGSGTLAEPTDEHVRDMVLGALESPAFMDRLRGSDDIGAELYAEIRADEEELEELARDMGERRITRKEWMIARQPVEERLEHNRARLAKVSRAAVLLEFVGSFEDMQARWKELNTSQRRAIIRACVRSISVVPAKPRNRWTPDRFVFDWIA